MVGAQRVVRLPAGHSLRCERLGGHSLACPWWWWWGRGKGEGEVGPSSDEMSLDECPQGNLCWIGRSSDGMSLDECPHEAIERRGSLN